MFRRSLLLIVLLPLLLATIACNPPKRDAEAVKTTITMYSHMSREVFDREVREPVEKKFPEAKLRFVFDQGFSMMHPDLPYADILHLNTLVLLNGSGYAPWHFDLQEGERIPAENLEPYISPDSPIHQIDPGLMAQARWRSPDGALTAIPYASSPIALFYHKRMLDERGLPYPVDGMTWEDVYEYIKQLPEGSKINLDPVHKFPFLMYQLSLPIGKNEIDIELAEQKWRTIIDLIDRMRLGGHSSNHAFIDSVGRPSADEEMQAFYRPTYLFPSYHFHNLQYRDEMDWILKYWIEYLDFGEDLDAVAFPAYAADSNVGTVKLKEYLMVGEHSANKQLSFRIVEYLASPEFQKHLARRGIGPVILTEDIVSGFGADIQALQGRNLHAFYGRSVPEQPAGEVMDSNIGGRLYLNIGEQLGLIYSGNGDKESVLREIMRNYEMIVK